MAAAFCSLHQGSSLKKLHYYQVRQSYATRSYPGALTSNASKKSSLCCCTAQIFVCGIRISRLEFKKGIQCWRAFSGSIANYAENAHESETREDVPKATLIWRAVKLPIYSVALVPLTVGGAAAYLQTGIFSARRYFSLLVSSILIITWLNLRSR